MKDLTGFVGVVEIHGTKTIARDTSGGLAV